jgi:hypothetical protein
MMRFTQYLNAIFSGLELISTRTTAKSGAGRFSWR